jgi:hypothetical protein
MPPYNPRIDIGNIIRTHFLELKFSANNANINIKLIYRAKQEKDKIAE